MTLLSDAVAIINQVTSDLGLQVTGTQRVTLKKFAGDGGVGAPTYDPPNGRKYQAVVDRRQRQVRTFSGELAVSNTTVIFLVPTIAVNEGDVIVLADGTGGPVMGTSSPVDASGRLITEAFLG